MQDKFIVIGCNRFDGMIEGKRYTQTKVRCLGNSKSNDDDKGLAQIVMKGSYDLFDDLKVFPAVYDVDFEQTTGGNFIYSVKLVGDAIKLPLKYRCLDNSK